MQPLIVELSGTPSREEDSRYSIAFTAGQSVSEAVFLSGFFETPAVCSGLGLCGKCRMRYLSPAPAPVAAERAFFSESELEQGWRLTCRHAASAGTLLELPASLLSSIAPPASHTVTHSAPPHAPSLCTAKQTEYAASGAEGLLAIDLGTTTLEWEFSGGVKGPHLRGKRINPQMGAGSEVLSRVAFASTPQGLATLQNLTLHSIRSIIEECESATCSADETQPPSCRVTALCLAANPAMTAITLGAEVSGLAGAPYSIPFPGGAWAELRGLPPLWAPPQLAPFVGGDVSAGYARIMYESGQKPRFPFLLADMGTNGEFLLALSERNALCASVALGPALEGAGLRHGCCAAPGAITEFIATPTGLELRTLPAHSAATNDTDGRAPEYTAERAPERTTERAGEHSEGSPEAFPAEQRMSGATEPSCPGITGSGYLSLVRVLRACGALDEAGHFTPEKAGLFRRFFTPAHTAHGEAFLRLPHGFALYASDIEEILKVKAAFSLGLATLLEYAKLPTYALEELMIAGALGAHIPPHTLEYLGFIPPGLSTRAKSIGNASLQGASLLLREKTAREFLMQWKSGVQSVALHSLHTPRPHHDSGSSAPPPENSGNFTGAAFFRHMQFSWPDPLL